LARPGAHAAKRGARVCAALQHVAMPSIEELPDDYDLATDRDDGNKASSSSASHAGGGAAATSSSAASSGGAGALSRGFLNRPKGPRSANTAAASAPATSSGSTARPEGREAVPREATAAAAPAATASKAGAASTSAAEAPAGSADGIAKPSASSSTSAAASAGGSGSGGGGSGGGDEDELVDALRTRLCVAVEALTRAREEAAAADAATSAEGKAETEGVEALEELLAPLRAKWPSSQLRGSREKATAEIDAALAEMRAASNDARRHRSGEERLAANELRRAAEDATERIRKVAEAAAQREPSKEDQANAAIAAFHALPLTAKLRVLADEKAGWLLLTSSFLAGAAIMLAVLAEVYSAWNCGMKCAR